MFADLHLHTRFSDGTYSPQDLATAARRYGLAAIALTDHDTVEGCAATAEACALAGVEFLPGTELTAELEGDEIHILGYLFDTGHAGLLAQLAHFQAVRQNRIREMVARLNRAGVPLAAAAVFALAQCQAPGRPHVARALVQGGFCSNLDEAFERFLKKDRLAWVPKFKMSVGEAIALIHDAGGLAVMAHPGLNRTDELIPIIAAAGLDGLECYHSKHSSAATRRYLDLARELGLLITGGSDCHGASKQRPVMGTVKLPYEHVARLKAKAARVPVGPPPAEAPTCI